MLRELDAAHELAEASSPSTSSTAPYLMPLPASNFPIAPSRPRLNGEIAPWSSPPAGTARRRPLNLARRAPATGFRLAPMDTAGLRELDDALDAALARGDVPVQMAIDAADSSGGSGGALARRQPLGRGGARRARRAAELLSSLCAGRWHRLRNLQRVDEVAYRIFRVVRSARTLIDAQSGEGLFGRALARDHPIGVGARWRKQRMAARLEAVLLRAGGTLDAAEVRAKVLRMIAKFADGGGEPKLMAAVAAKYGLARGVVPEWHILTDRYPLLPCACLRCAHGTGVAKPWPSRRERGREVEPEMHIASVVVQTQARRRQAHVHVALHLGEQRHIADLDLVRGGGGGGGGEEKSTPAELPAAMAERACRACVAVKWWQSLRDALYVPVLTARNDERIRCARRHARLLVEQRHGRGLLSHSIEPADGVAARWRRRRLVARLTAIYDGQVGAEVLVAETRAAKHARRAKVETLVTKYGNHEGTLLERIRQKYGLAFVPEWEGVRAAAGGDPHVSAIDVAAALVVETAWRARCGVVVVAAKRRAQRG
jgi:hypothetical protein